MNWCNIFVIILFNIIKASNTIENIKECKKLNNIKTEIDQSKMPLMKETKSFSDTKKINALNYDKYLDDNHINFQFFKNTKYNTNNIYPLKKNRTYIDKKKLQSNTKTVKNDDHIDNSYQNVGMNNILEIKCSKNKNIVEKIIDDNKPINLCTKNKNIKKMSTIYEINTNNILCDKAFINHINSDENFLEFFENFKNLIGLYSFNLIFKIIENDFINILKSSIKFSNINNEYVMHIISNLEKYQLNEQKIIYFINVTNEILRKDINYKLYNDNKYKLLEKILYTKYYKNHNKKMIYNKLYKKAARIKSYVSNEIITYDEIFFLTIYYINKIADIQIKCFFAYGLQSLFVNFSKNVIPRLYFVLVFLHIFIKEKDFYDVDWHEKMFKILSISYSNLKNQKYYYNILYEKNENSLIKTFKIYISMNSEWISYALQNYRELQNNELHLKCVNYLINLTNKAKCKLIGLKF